MRIGLFTDTYLPDINGVVSSTVILKNALEKAGHTVFVITNHAGSKIELEDRVLRLPGIPLKGLYGYKMSSPISMRAGTYIRNMNLDIIHLQTNFGVGLYGQSMAKLLGIPLVDTYHTMFEDYTHYINPMGFAGVDKVSKEAIRAASRNVCNHVQAVVAPSLKTKEVLEEYGVIAPIYVVATGLDLSSFEKTAARTEEALALRKTITEDPQATLLIFLGRLAKEKSLEIPIETIAASSDPHLHLAVVGAGPDEEYYQDLAKKLECTDRVHFMGKASPQDVPLYYAACDGFVSASLSETQGMTYLEAMAAGLMVFGRRDEVLSELISEGETGYYFDNPQELDEKIQVFQSLDRAQREDNKVKCRKRIAGSTDTAFAHKMLAVYDQAVLDYSKTFTVEKLKVGNDFVTLTLSRESSKELEKIMIPLEDYFELKISLGTKLDDYLVVSYVEMQESYHAWSACKKKLFSKDMTKAQILRYCKTDLNLDDETSQELIRELEERKLLNDRQYALDKADYWQSIGYSSRQIGQKLAKAGVEPEDIREAQSRLVPEREVMNAKNLATRLVKTVKMKSSQMKRQAILNKLLSKGYDMETARLASEELNFDEDDRDALEQVFSKACRLYAREPLEKRRLKIRNYCRQRGFSGPEVDELLESEFLND